ncbi:recombinase family protein [Paenarthrobacter nitroguajacolicus]|uniref:recombinase family protein n=1 Tax=Paenarthrobacter nitroguajacolicus TaxID=211146 RepID=UPI00351D77B8
MTELNQRGIQFKSLTGSFLDTTTAEGRLIFQISAALAEHERSRMLERNRAGLESRPCWRPRRWSDVYHDLSASKRPTHHARGEDTRPPNICGACGTPMEKFLTACSPHANRTFGGPFHMFAVKGCASRSSPSGAGASVLGPKNRGITGM